MYFHSIQGASDGGEQSKWEAFNGCLFERARIEREES